MANLSSLNNRIVINSNVISNPTAPNSVTLNSRRATDDLNRISSYINNILVPAFNTLSSGERYPFDVSQHGLGGSTIPTHLESCGNNNKLSELYWKISSEPGGGRPTTIKESFDYLNTRINYTLNLIQKPEISFPPEIGNLPEQVNNLFGYIKKMFFDLYSSPNETHDLIPDINPTVPAYSTTSLIYQLYNQLFDVDLNGQGIPSNFYDLVDQSEKTGLTISLKNNLFVTELENLTDVNVVDKTDSQVLSWNEAQGKWVPVDKDSGPGYTSTTYNAATGQVTFNSDYPELALTTGDLRGPAGADGAAGSDGQDALWNYRGEYGLGDVYAIGDVVTYDGRTWYRKDANGGNQGDTPSIGLFWDLLADKGANGNSGSDALWNVRGQYSGLETYAIGDVVQYNGSSYYKHSEPIGMLDIPIQSNWYLIAQKGENGAPGPAGADGQQGPQGPEGPTGSIKLLSDVSDSMVPNDNDALIWSATNSEWYATKVALGISTSGDYVESLIAGTGISLSPNASSPTVSLASGVATIGTYKSVTVDTYGRVTTGTNPTTLAGYGITDAQPLDADLTSIAGLAGTSGYLRKTAANTWSLDTSTFVDTTSNQTIGGTKTFSNTISGNISGNANTATNLSGGTDNRLLYQSSFSSTSQIANGAANTFLVSNASDDSLAPSFKTLTVKQSILLSQQSELPMQFDISVNESVYPPHNADNDSQDNRYSIYNTKFFINPPASKTIRNLRSYVLFNNNFGKTITINSINITLGSLRIGSITFQLVKYSNLENLLSIDSLTTASNGGSLIGDTITVEQNNTWFAAASTTVNFATPIGFDQGQFLGLVCVDMSDSIEIGVARKLIVNIFGEMNSTITLA